MEAEQNVRARNKLLATREDFSAVVSPQTFQKFKSMKRVSNGSKSADSQKSTADGSDPQQSSENGDYILKVTSEEYDQLKKKYTKNKRAVKQKPAEQQSSRSKSKSPSTLKLREKVEETNKQGKSPIEDANKQERSPRNSGVGLKQSGKDNQERSPRNSGVGLKQNGKDNQERSPRNSGIGLKQNGKDNQERSPRNSGIGLKQNRKDNQERSPRNSGVGLKLNGKDKEERSPRNSGVGLKQNGKAAQKKITENISPASRNNLKPENKPASRKSYDVADSKTKTETNDKSRWSVGMASGKSFDDGDGLLDTSLLKGKQSDNSKLGEPSSADVLDNAQEKKGRKRASLIPKSPNKQGNTQKKDNNRKRNSIEKGNKNRKSSTSKDHSSSNKEDINVESGQCLKRNRSEENLLESVKPELEKDVEVITNQIKQLKIEDNNQDLTNEVCETGTQPKYVSKTGGKSRATKENKKILSNDSGLKLDDPMKLKTEVEEPSILEDEKKTSLMNGKKLSDKSEDQLVEVDGKPNSVIVEKVADFRFVTKRMDESLAADIQLPSVDLDGCLENSLNKCDVKDTNGKDTDGKDSNGKDTNDNNFSSVKYHAVPGTSKSCEVSLEENLQASLSTAIKLVKKTTPTARTPIILKTPKRLKDGEIMSEMLIYKLGSHSTPRKIRKNRNLDSFRRSDWGTPVTDRITSSFQTRKISKKVKGKMFIKKTSKGALQPLPISKLVPKLNSPRRGQSPNKSAKDKNGDETYKVVPVSDLIKKFENLEKVDEPAVTQSNKVAVTFKKNAIFEKWQNGAKGIQGLIKLKEVEKKPPVLEVTNNETPIKIKQETNSENEKETTPTSNTDSTNNNENFNSLTILNGDCVDTMSFVSLKFEQIYSDECNDQSGKNMRFSDLYKEINFQLSDNEKIEVGENTNDGSLKVEAVTKTNSEYLEPTQQDTNNADKTIISNNEQGQGKAFEEGTDVLEIIEGEKSVDDKNYEGDQVEPPNQLTKDEKHKEHPIQSSKDVQIEEHTIQPTKDVKIVEHTIPPIEDEKIVEHAVQSSKVVQIVEHTIQPTKDVKIVEHAIQPTKDAQIVNDVRVFEEVIAVAEGQIDTTGEDRASPAYEAGVIDDVMKEEEQFGDSFRQQLLSMESHDDDDDTSISTLLALSQKVSKQPMSYADYRKQFMAVKSRSLPPQPKINRCDTDDPKMSL